MKIQTNEIISELIEKINSYSVEGESFEAVFAYNGKVSPVPVDRTYIAFSTCGTGIEFFTNEDEECCKQTNVTIEAAFYVSSVRRAKDIYSLMETVMDYLLVEYAGKMTEYNAGGLEIDDNMRLMKIPCTMKFTYRQCPAYGVGGDVILPFADFLCKTHVNDNISHLTEKEKQFVAQPFLFGSYVGNGDDYRKINLGFRPSMVLLFCGSGCGFGYDNNQLKSYLAMAFSGKTTKGLTLFSEGLEIRMGEDVVADGIEPCLNALGKTYCYMVMQ